MELVVQLFTYAIDNNDPNKVGKIYRQYEFDQCLYKNLKNPIFSTIHVLLESDSALQHYKQLIEDLTEKNKCKFTVFGKQPKYSDLVHYVASLIENDKIVCIMNSDIFMGSTNIDYIRSELDYNTFIALTRHEFTNEEHSTCNVDTCSLIYKYWGSHDAFIFKTPVPTNYNYNYVNIPQNINGSEAIFMKSWVMCNKQLKNLCFDIPVFHMHKHRFIHYPTIATHVLCNVRPTVPKNRNDIEKQMIKMF